LHEVSNLMFVETHLRCIEECGLPPNAAKVTKRDIMYEIKGTLVQLNDLSNIGRTKKFFYLLSPQNIDQLHLLLKSID